MNSLMRVSLNAVLVIVAAAFVFAPASVHAQSGRYGGQRAKTTVSAKSQVSVKTANSLKYKRVLITTFHWMEATNPNASIPAGKQLAAHLRAQGAVVKVCIMPVLWDDSAKMAMDCFREMGTPPDYVFSIGEGGEVNNNEILVSLAAGNLDSGPGDARGESRYNQLIDPKEPSKLEFALPVDRLVSSALARNGIVRFNENDAGAYICNNTAFHLRQEMRARSIPYVFVHVAPLYGNAESGPHSGDMLYEFFKLL